MADFESGEPVVPQIPSSNVSKHSSFTNDGQIYDPTPSQPKDTSAMEPSSQGNNNSQSEMAKESPKKIKSPIAAAAADREIALRVWMASSDRNDDVRDALGRMLGWVEELAGLLHTTLKAKSELQTTLTVTESNLALALSNTEMLEEALKRDASGRRADVGWARSSGGPTPATAPIAKSETGFFKFLRSNGGASTPPPGHLHRDSGGSAGMHTPHASIDGPSSSTPNLLKSQSHLNSPSMPSLHSGIPGTSKREEELAQALRRERESTTKVLREKQQLEEELESLSQALFEEANRMVSTERRQRAQIEEELQNVRQEREALKGALRIVEGENSSLRSGAAGAARSHHASVSDSSSSSRDRPRALTIDTDRVDEKPASGIDISQTPSTSELPSQSRERTPLSTVDTKPNAGKFGTEEPELWNAPNGMPQTRHSRKGTAESGGSKYDYVPRGSLTFGM